MSNDQITPPETEASRLTQFGERAKLIRNELIQFVKPKIAVIKDEHSFDHILIIALTTFYALWFSLLSLRLYDTYQAPPFDLAVFDQGLWLLSHFHTPFVTIMGRNLFGDHTSFILLFVAPFYRLVPEPQGILVLQSFIIAIAALPIYAVARARIGGVLIPTALAGAFLLNPALERGNLEQFHPESFQVLFLSLAIYAALNAKGRLLAVTVILSLLVKEDAAAYTTALGAWVFWRRNRRWGTMIIAASLAYALVANYLIIPAFLGASTFYGDRIPFGGFGGLVRTIFAHPGQFITYFFQNSRPYYVWQLLISFGGAFLLSPEIAAIAILGIGENVLSTFPYQQQIIYHYTMPIIPVLAMGVVYAVSQQKLARIRWIVTAIVFSLTLWTSYMWGAMPYSLYQVSQPYATDPAAQADIQTIQSFLPPNAPVSAWYPYVAHIDHRTRIYVWTNPYSTQNWGLGTNYLVLPAAATTTYLMLPVPLSSQDNPDVLATIEARYQLVHQRGTVGLYELKSALLANSLKSKTSTSSGG